MQKAKLKKRQNAIDKTQNKNLKIFCALKGRPIMGGKHHGGTGRKTEENKKYKMQNTKNRIFCALMGGQQ